MSNCRTEGYLEPYFKCAETINKLKKEMVPTQVTQFNLQKSGTLRYHRKRCLSQKNG